MPDLAECLRERTQNLQNEIEWIKAARGQDSQAALEHLRHVRSELSECGDLIRAPEFGCSSAAQKSASQYRDCLQRLQEALPKLQAELLAERSRLQPQREHLDAAVEWIHGSKTTL
jgi:hypothetical protein